MLYASALVVTLAFQASGRVLKTSEPPRGWNSWDCFGNSNESSTLATLDALAGNSGLLNKGGYSYVTIDEGWFGSGDIFLDSFGRPIPDPTLYPSSNRSFKYMSDYARSKGLKFGLWYMGGIPRRAVEKNSPIKGTQYRARDLYKNVTYCPRWNAKWGYEIDHDHPAAQAWYDSLVELWSEWGLAWVKVDCINAQDESVQHRLDIIRLHDAFERVAPEHDFVLSLSPGGFSNISQLLDIAPYVSMARVTDDFWDTWDLYMSSGGHLGSASGYSHWDAARDLVAAVDNRAGQTFWIDLDMLPLGRIGQPGQACSSVGVGCPRRTRFTEDEQRSIVALWALVQSPLIMGGDVRPGYLDAFTQDLLTNPLVLDMTRDIGRARESIRVNRTDAAYIVWQASNRKSPSGEQQFCAIFNLMGSPSEYAMPLQQLGLNDQWSWRNLWHPEPVKIHDGALHVSLPAHGVLLAAVSREPSLLI